jgi:carbamoyl-phosphate synthase large subunit
VTVANKTSEKATVLLTPGGGPGILAQVASLAQSSRYPARIVMADCNPASGNLFLPDIDARYRLPKCDSDEYLPALLRLIRREKVDILYSGLDEELPVLAKNREAIAEAGCGLLIPPVSALEDALDKKRTFQILRERVEMPRSWFLDEQFDAAAVYEQCGGDLLLKATASRGGRYIYIPQDVEEYHFYLRRVRKLMSDAGLAFMVQERIRGTEYNTTTLSGNDGTPVYAISRRKFESRQVKSTTTAAVIEERRDVIEQALTAVSTMGLTPGFNNIECIVSEKNDHPYFIEINGGRMAAQDMNVVAAGVQPTDLLIDLCRGVDTETVNHPAGGTAILKIRKDVVVSFADIAAVEQP